MIGNCPLRRGQSRQGPGVLAGLLLLGLCGLAGCARQGEYPSQPITLLCPWSAGGGTDRVSRQMAALLETELGVPVNVINATGGSGVTGHARGALARPDGYTLTMITVELNMLHWRGLTNITPDDFAPLMLLNRDSAAVLVRHDSPFATLDALEAAIRSQPGKLKMSGTAQGGIWHVAVAGWLLERGLSATSANWISINGAGPSLQELTAGGIDFVCCSLPEADALLAGGQVRCLGVMADARVPGYEQIPTFREQGHSWAMAGWRGLAAPRETPPDHLRILAGAVGRVTETAAFRDFMRQSGFTVALENPEAFRETLRQQDALFEEILGSEAFAGVSDERVGPMMFPAVIACLLLLVGIPVWWHPTLREPSDAAMPWKAWGNALVAMLAILWFLLVVEHLGFVLTAFGLLWGLMWRLRVRGLLAGGVSLLVSVLVFQVFGVLLRVPLPRGFWGW
ncbi:MAG: tripartite tricarboxylate transporter substrate-binding protein [Planctomycetaceae bacterium]|nr:tripartite tricarboxylate transporter TctB family protein [Planctomycetaceae bacterium]